MNIQDMIPLKKILLSVKHTGFEQTILLVNSIDNLPVLAGFFFAYQERAANVQFKVDLSNFKL